jgi:monoamine oxidase
MNKNKKIIIVGAGIAGLAACNELTKCGFETMLLEARDRIGGRISTDYTLGIPIGRGAAWIHGVDGNPITELANKFNVKMAASDLDKFRRYDGKGNIISIEDVGHFNDRFETLLKKAKEFSYQSRQDISLAAALSPFINLSKLSPVEKALLEMKLAYFEGYTGANYESLSARHWDAEEIWPGHTCFLINSYQPILEGLQKNCRIHLNTVVKEINLHRNHVEVKTENTSFNADAVLITVPLGVLKKNSIQFTPPLSGKKQEAIHRVGMGIFNITAIKFPRVFWPKEPHAFFFAQLDALSIPVFFNLYHFHKQPILLGYSGGERAKRLEKLSDIELVEKTMQNFKQFYGMKLPEPESYFNTRWSSDPFSYGSYSYLPVGASSSDYDLIAAPINNQLFFAGEATHSRYPATTHGAWLSGMREAARLRGQV